MCIHTTKIDIYKSWSGLNKEQNRYQLKSKIKIREICHVELKVI